MPVDLGREAERLLAARGQVPEAERLHDLFRTTWAYTLQESPEMATYTGTPGYDHLWMDMSLAAYERRNRDLDFPVRVIASLDRAQLTPEDQVHADLFRRNAEEALEGRRFPAELLPLNQMSGVQQSVAQILGLMSFAHTSDYEHLVARLHGVRPLVDQNIELMREGLRRGLTPPRITLRDVPQQVRNQIVDDPLTSPLLRAFATPAPGVEATSLAPLRESAVVAYRSAVAPAYTRLLAFLEQEYIPQCRDTIGLSALPDGAAWYAFNARQSTTTRLSPEEIHAIGVSEVARIRGEMDAVVTAAGFSGSLAEFVHFLRTDDQFFFRKPEDLLVAYRDICKRADPELPRLFGTLPRLPYGVIPVPSYAEKSQTTAYYEPGSPASGRPGNFYANTYDLRARPKWEMEALALHEAVPGHHLQIALAQELQEMPEFRKHGFYTAYIEGWGLYSESLGREMGFYKDPYARFGQLTYEIWRAIRLVLDTGIHALGWSRERAIAYFEEHAGKAEHDIVVEVDRYIVWPGQALAYKIGELKIQELRRRAALELGDRFSLRAFHDVVLGSGAVPLDVLEQQVAARLGLGASTAP
jgi:uncharacterized protein (DUF885 family)